MKKQERAYKERLVEERRERNLTQQDMADLMGYKSKATYCNIENGATNPSLETMNKIATILGKPVKYFFAIKS
ncbi:MAG TPA: helix-turn-helix transcriptional regulator [Thermoanaerobacterales bacterium]|nr:helix-turn-helix transcriptional regulator [Thermoanaerobacterales bacterium]